jgi:hypothetical protein
MEREQAAKDYHSNLNGQHNHDHFINGISPDIH